MEYINQTLTKIEYNPILKKQFAELNLKAGNKAKSELSFQQAYTFYSKGIEIMPSDNWARNYDDTLKLYRGRIECAYLTGDKDEAEKHFKTAASKANSAEDKAKLYILKMDFLIRQDYCKDAVQAGMAALKLLGFPIKTDQVSEGSIGAKLLKIITKIQPWLNEQEEEKENPFTELDERTELAIRCISTLQEAAFILKNDNFYGWLIAENIEIIMEHGFTKSTGPAALNALSALLSTSTVTRKLPKLLGKDLNGIRLARNINGLALKWLEQYPDDQSSGIVKFYTGLAIEVWTKNLTELHEYFTDSITACVNSGSPHLPYACIGSYIYHAEASPLHVQEAIQKEVFTKILASKNKMMIDAIKIIPEIMNWMKDENEFSRKVDPVRWEELLHTHGGDTIGMFYSMLFRMLIIKGDYQTALDINGPWAESIEIVEKTRVFPYMHVSKCCIGISKLHLAVHDKKMHSKKRTQYLKDAKANIKWLKKNSKLCADHIALHRQLLQAEYDAADHIINGNPKKKNYTTQKQAVIEAFETAIKTAEQCDYKPLISITRERLALFYKAVGNTEKHLDELFNTIQAYKNWGATAKIKALLNGLLSEAKNEAENIQQAIKSNKKVDKTKCQEVKAKFRTFINSASECINPAYTTEEAQEQLALADTKAEAQEQLALANMIAQTQEQLALFCKAVKDTKGYHKEMNKSIRIYEKSGNTEKAKSLREARPLTPDLASFIGVWYSRESDPGQMKDTPDSSSLSRNSDPTPLGSSKSPRMGGYKSPRKGHTPMWQSPRNSGEGDPKEVKLPMGKKTPQRGSSSETTPTDSQSGGDSPISEEGRKSIELN